MTQFTVQKTNDTSSVSKSSCATRGFFKDPYISLFITRYRNRCPAINHGYFMRNFAVNSVVRDFLSSSSNSQIIVLGSGFDTLYFNLKDEGYDMTFIEIDYEPVIYKKLKIIKRTPELSRHVNYDENVELGDFILLNTPQYKLIGVDMRDTYLLIDLMSHVANSERPTLVLSECVLTYIGSKNSNQIIKITQTYFDQLVFCLFEQIRPFDTFGKIMIEHFRSRGTPLYGALKYSTVEAVKERFRKLGFDMCKAEDIQSVYLNSVPLEVKIKTCSLDPFDEFEEFFQTISHYFISCASKRLPIEHFSVFKKFEIPSVNTLKQELSLGTNFLLLETIPIKYHAHRCVILGGDGQLPVYLVFGGYGELTKGRGKAVIPLMVDELGNNLDFKYESELPPNSFPRLFFGAHYIERLKRIIIFGGRASPLKPLNSVLGVDVGYNDMYTLKVDELSCWGDLPAPCWRFASTLFDSENYLFINGGLEGVNNMSGRSYSLDLNNFRWMEIELTGQVPDPLMSHTVCEGGGKLYMFGGLRSDHSVSSDLFVVDIKTLHSRKVPSQLEERFSHTAHVYNSKLILCGGINSRGLNAGLGVYDLNTGVTIEYEFPICGVPLMLFLHDSHLVRVEVDNKDETVLRIFGGGCQCFTFGSHVNMASVDIRLDII